MFTITLVPLTLLSDLPGVDFDVLQNIGLNSLIF